MSIFYIGAVLLAVIGLLFVCYPWLRKNAALERLEVSNVNVIRGRIVEIEREAAEGLINQDEMQQSIEDMKLALVDEMQIAQKQQSSSSIKGLLFGAIPTLAIGIWVYVDANQLSGLSQLTYALNNTQELNNRIVLQPANDVTPDEFQKYALVIRQQLRSKPDDAIGWTWLGRINMTLGQLEESVNAFKKALNLKPGDDDLRSRYAQAAMMRGDEEGLGIAKNQLAYLIEKSPQNREYRLLMTVIAAQLQDNELAFTNFALIRDQLDPQSNLFQSLSEQLRKMGAPEFLLSYQGADSSETSVNTNTANKAPAQIDEQTNEAQANKQNTEATARVSLEVFVSITEELAAKLPDNGFLIVFAQDASGQSRMPLAVKRIALPKLPITITLSEDDAMITNFSLASAEKINLTARISMDSDVMPSAGELEGVLENIQLSAKPVMLELIIDKELF